MIDFLSLTYSKDEVQKAKRRKLIQSRDKEIIAPIPLNLFSTVKYFVSENEITSIFQSTVPSKKVAWLLIDRYFKYVHPFYPFLDQADIYKEFNRILGEKSYKEEKIQVKIEKRLDFARISLVCMILRMGKLTLYDNQNRPIIVDKSNPDYENVLYLLKTDPVDDKVTVLQQLALSPFNILSGYSYEAFEGMLHMKLIQQLAPEEGDVFDFSSTYSGLIYDMSFNLGLNRDPTKYPGFLNDKRMLNKYRKTWFSILQSDSIQGFMTIRPFPNDFERQDTKFPEFEGEENNNNFDIEIEKYSKLH
ncbi:unnamed protein product [[Candida] boidinii]|uniref:Unnamed protein product n=1 Tax=Candida boidinii TaxID=5477 RepID=A0A9W6T8Z7_CANBO|nr:unnamed protein product [[Candida] boidinii]